MAVITKTPGGGVSKKKIEAATALPADVKEGKTFYAGGKEIKTGTAKLMNQINGVQKDYYAYAGENIHAGDLVTFTEGVAGVGAGVAEWKSAFEIRNGYLAGLHLTKKIDSTRFLAVYDAGITSSGIRICSIDGLEVSWGAGIATTIYRDYRYQRGLSIHLVGSNKLAVFSQADEKKQVYCTLYQYAGKALSRVGSGYAFAVSDYRVASDKIAKISDTTFARIVTDGIMSTNVNTTSLYIEFLSLNTTNGSLGLISRVSLGRFNTFKTYDEESKEQGSPIGFTDDGKYLYIVQGGVINLAKINGTTIGTMFALDTGYNIGMCDTIFAPKKIGENLYLIADASFNYAAINPLTKKCSSIMNTGYGNVFNAKIWYGKDSTKYPGIITDEISNVAIVTKMCCTFGNAYPTKMGVSAAKLVVAQDSAGNITIKKGASKDIEYEEGRFPTGQTSFFMSEESLTLGLAGTKGCIFSTYRTDGNDNAKIMIISAEGDEVEPVAYTYETQVKKAASNGEINGVALTDAKGGVLTGEHAGHNQKTRVVSKTMV